MSHNFQSFVKGLDMFSQPFVFFVGEKKNKSTFLGGFLSLSVFAISSVYFYYLINMYFSNQIQPKITSSISIESEYISIDITEGFFIFEMLIDGEPLKQYEKRVGKTFLTYVVNYETFDSDGSFIQEEIPYSNCLDPKFSGYLCIDDSAIVGKDVYLRPIENKYTIYSLSILFCDETKISNCATKEEMLEVLLTPQNQVAIFIKIRQYSPSLREYKEGFKAEYFVFDPNLFVFTRMSLIKATTTVTEGVIKQSSTISNDIFDFKRIDAYLSTENIIQRFGVDGFAYIVFENNQISNIINIQHAMVTEVLAQFMSILNPLLIFGIFARILAGSRIIDEISNILLQVYYKQTALELVEKKEGNHSQVKDKKQTQKQGNFLKRRNSKSLNPSKESKTISLLQKKISQTNFAEEGKKYFNMSIFHRIKFFLRKTLVGGNKQNEGQKEAYEAQGEGAAIYQQILTQSMKRINILEVYKDLIKLKMFVKLMLTKEQYAAMQFCGSNLLLSGQKQSEGKIEGQIEQGSSVWKQNQQEKSRLPFQNQVASIQGESSPKIINTPKTSQSNNYLLKINQEVVFSSRYKDPSSPNVSNNIGEIGILADSQVQQIHQPQEKQYFINAKEILSRPENETQQKGSSQLQEFSAHVIQGQDNQDDKEKEETHINIEKQVNNSLIPMSSTRNRLQSEQISIVKMKGDEIEIIDNSSEENRDNQDGDQSEQKDYRLRNVKDDYQDNVKEDNEQGMLESHLDQKQEKEHKLGRADGEQTYLDLLQVDRSHLYELDSIDESADLQEKMLKAFLQNIRCKLLADPNGDHLSHIDKHILQSLLLDEIPQIEEPLQFKI